MKYAIFDLDNCLADDSERIPLIDWTTDDMDQRYAAYHAACGEDRVGNWAIFKQHTEALHMTPVFLTARPGNVHEQTLTWIQEHLGIAEPVLMMRNAGDQRRSVDIKREMLTWLDHYGIRIEEVAIAFDDHPDIVAMYREAGLNAAQVRIHDLCAYSPPGRVKAEEGMMVREIEVEQSTATTPQRRSPDSFLRLAAETFQERTAQYGTLYKDLEPIYAALFPKGLTLGSPGDFTRFSILIHIINKTARYARSLDQGGHEDSAHDLMVYAAMLREVTR